MDDAREAHLLRQIPTLGCLDEAQGFAQQLRDGSETMTAAIMVRLQERIDYLASKELPRR